MQLKTLIKTDSQKAYKFLFDNAKIIEDFDNENLNKRMQVFKYNKKYYTVIRQKGEVINIITTNDINIAIDKFNLIR